MKGKRCATAVVMIHAIDSLNWFRWRKFRGVVIVLVVLGLCIALHPSRCTQVPQFRELGIFVIQLSGEWTNKKCYFVNDGGSIYKILFSICWSKMSTVNSVSGFLGIILHFNLQIFLASGRVSASKINLLSYFPREPTAKTILINVPETNRHHLKPTSFPALSFCWLDAWGVAGRKYCIRFLYSPLYALAIHLFLTT